MINFYQSENIKTLYSLCFKYNCYVVLLEDKNGKPLKIVIECINRPFYLRTDFPLTIPIESIDLPDWESIESAIIDFSLPYLFT